MYLHVGILRSFQGNRGSTYSKESCSRESGMYFFLRRFLSRRAIGIQQADILHGLSITFEEVAIDVDRAFLPCPMLLVSQSPLNNDILTTQTQEAQTRGAHTRTDTSPRRDRRAEKQSQNGIVDVSSKNSKSVLNSATPSAHKMAPDAFPSVDTY